jgi:hypothetical protein
MGCITPIDLGMPSIPIIENNKKDSAPITQELRVRERNAWEPEYLKTIR